MLIFDRGQKQWFILTIVLLTLATFFYLWSDRTPPRGHYSSTGPGLWFGVLGTLAMGFAALLSLRKRLIRFRLGSLRWWLKGHIWLGLLSIPLLMFHADFRWGGLLESLLWLLFSVVVVSGVAGLAAQNIIPRIMKVELPSEAIPEQINHRCEALRLAADKIVHEHCQSVARAGVSHREATADTLDDFFQNFVRPFLGIRYDGSSELHHASRAEGVFAEFRRPLPVADREIVTQLEDFCRQRRQLNLQARMFGWLHVWLLVHIPLSFALLVLVLLHIGTALYY